MTSGQYQHMPKPPYCPGLEYAGEVAWSRGGASVVRVGDRGPRGRLPRGAALVGAYQAYGRLCVVRGRAGRARVHRVPRALRSTKRAISSETTRPRTIASSRVGRLQAGETVLIHGASGATGLAAVQLAKLLGATVIATGRSERSSPSSRRTGRITSSCARRAGGRARRSRVLRDEVKALTGGRGVDVVYDGVGGDISLESLRCVRFGARFLIVGWAATPFVAKGKGQRGAPNANMLPTNLIMMKGLDVLGCPTVISRPTARASRAAPAVMAWAAEGPVRPHVSHVFPLADFKEAMRAKWRGDVVGGCVLHP